MDYLEYSGMTYEQASREGLRLIRNAGRSQLWLLVPERLIALRTIMDREWKREMKKKPVKKAGKKVVKKGSKKK